MKDTKIVIDEFAAQYELGDEVGSGGQGTVYYTQYDNVLVKLLKANISDERKKAFNKKMRFLRRLDLNGINVSLPAVLLSDKQTGYVMELMDDMVPLSELLVPKDEEGKDIKAEKIGGWYLKTGGIKRRVQILINLAKVINDIHSEGLAYGDISPTNIFISESPEYSEVQLIDCDNITPISEINDEMILTPDYGAPEMVRGESGYNSLTDAWSFAVIAYQLLTLNHPFKGIAFEDGDPDEVEKSIAEGKLPWIFDEEDDSNEALGTGVPNELVISPKMMELFQTVFGGDKSPQRRVGIQEWLEALETVSRSLGKCSNPKCNAHFFFNKKCPFCEEKAQNRILLKTIRWEPFSEIDENELENGTIEIDNSRYYHKVPNTKLPVAVLNQGESIDISRSLYEDFIEDGTSLRFEYQEDGILKLTPKDNKQITIRTCEDPESKSFIVGSDFLLGKAKEYFPGGIRKNYAVHLGEINESHRVILFSWVGK